MKMQKFKKFNLNNPQWAKGEHIQLKYNKTNENIDENVKIQKKKIMEVKNTKVMSEKFPKVKEGCKKWRSSMNFT